MKRSNGGAGTQKRARFERLKQEITRFVMANHGCSAQSIVANLSHDRSMRNHGLTPRKVGSLSLVTLQKIDLVADHRAGESIR